MMTILVLIWEFFKTGLFAVGGGLATIPFLKDMTTRHNWFTAEEITDMIAVSESTPGPIGVNMATYAGYNAGLADTGNILVSFVYGMISTLGLIAPSIIIILIVSTMLDKFKGNKIVDNAFYGIRPASAALIVAAMADVFIMSITGVDIAGYLRGNLENFSISVVGIAIFVVFVPLVIKLKKVHPLVFIAAGAVLGIVFKM